MRRAWPDGDRLRLELVDGAGGLVAAVAEAGRLTAVGIEDERLPALAGWARRPGARLLVHRPGRRAVVRVPTADGRATYVKVARRGAIARALAAHRAMGRLLSGGADAPLLPVLLDADVEAGWLRLAELPGRSLLEVLSDRTVCEREAVAAGRAAGRCLSTLARIVPHGLPEHGRSAEAEVVTSWVDRMASHAPLGDEVASRIREAALRTVTDLLALPLVPAVAVHRDLHDKQLLVEGSATGLIDLDTASAGDPAIDAGNLLAHLDLRVCQGLVPSDRAGAVARALMRARQAGAPLDPCRVAVHRSCTRARLAALYCFRPGAARVVGRLLDGVGTGPL